MPKTSFLELAETRRSVRAYKPDPVPEDLVQTVLEAGRLAPSACNKQPWRFLMAPRGDASRSRLEPMVAGYSDWALDAGLLVTRQVQRASRNLRLHYAWPGPAHRTPGRALQWWLTQLESPATRKALMENHHRQ